jgi:hypothetical protein
LIGNARQPVELPNPYSHFAAVYHHSPLGLALRGAKDEKLHGLLQELAWHAVCSEPLSGVKPDFWEEENITMFTITGTRSHRLCEGVTGRRPRTPSFGISTTGTFTTGPSPWRGTR